MAQQNPPSTVELEAVRFSAVALTGGFLVDLVTQTDRPKVLAADFKSRMVVVQRRNDKDPYEVPFEQIVWMRRRVVTE